MEVNEIEDDEIDILNPTKFTKSDVNNLELMEIDEVISE